jgi:thiaminase
LLETDIYDITSDEIIAGRRKGISEERLQRRARDKQEAHIDKILRIIKGADYKSFGKKYEEIAQKMKRDHPNKEIEPYEIWIRAFDGSGCETWWD